MKKLFAIGLLMMGLFSLAGCHNWRHVQNTNTGKTPLLNPTVEQLVRYLNENAGRVKAIQSNSVQIDARQGLTGIGADGLLVFEKPRNFRLKARVVGKDGVDIGSNTDEFWYWTADDPQRFVYHCAYEDLKRGNVPIPPFFQPELIIAALGVQEYDPAGKYEIKVLRDTIELTEASTSPQGQPLQKVVTFSRNEVGPGEPQVRGLALRDGQGKDILQVQYLEVQLDPATNAILPYRMKITLSQGKEKAELTLRLRDLRSVQLQPQQSQRLFSRADLMQSRPGFDLARQQPDSAVGTGELRPVGGIQPPSRR